MSTQILSALVSVMGISLISFVGIAFFLAKESFVQRVMIYLVSFSTGALFGNVFLHMLPEIAEEHGFSLFTSSLILTGIVLSFCIEKFVHWNHCHHMPSKDHYHPVGTMTLVADGLHNIVDGIVIAASFYVDIRLGIATTLAVALHEIPQEIGDYALLLYSGYSRSRALLFNFLSGLTAVLGAVLTIVAIEFAEHAIMYIVPIAAGNLLYIAGSDLIPELHKHSKPFQSFLQLLSILAGVLTMSAMLLLE